MVRILLYVKGLRSNVKGELLIPLVIHRQVGHGTIGLREQLPMVIWPLVGFLKKYEQPPIQLFVSWVGGCLFENVVQVIDRKIRKKLIFRILRIIRSDPVGIQTQDLQNRNLTLYSAKLRDLKYIYFKRFKTDTNSVTIVAIEVPMEPMVAMVCADEVVFVGTMISQPGSILAPFLAFVTVPF